MSQTLTIIGGGHVGKTLGRLWTLHRTFVVQDVLSRSLASSRQAISFIGAGRAIGDYAGLQPSDIYLIATPDDQIAQCAERLARTGHLSASNVVFHCSGALASGELQAARHCGAAVASIHPIRSFAAPEQVVQSFAGTYCGAEGEQRALDILSAAFSAIGAQLVPINGDFKMLYHSAAVFASNYLVTLLDVAQQAYAGAGVPNDVALAMMEPLIRKTVDDIFRIGPENALSGPIARGDMTTAAKQYHAVRAWDKRHGTLYKQLGRATVDLAARRNKYRQ